MAQQLDDQQLSQTHLRPGQAGLNPATGSLISPELVPMAQPTSYQAAIQTERLVRSVAGVRAAHRACLSASLCIPQHALPSCTACSQATG